MDNLQNELNKEWLDIVLAETLKEWNKENKEDYTIEEFVEFIKEIAEIKFM